ncbi:MAG TPA: peptidoglycan editing factor PgeF [Bacillota bacterium]|nr:peptidoglycan editing factor PgeF [Bacillota bacterium]
MSEPFTLTAQTHLSLESWQKVDQRLKVGFSTRCGGVSEGFYESLNLGLHVADESSRVIANREILAKQLTIPLQHWVSGSQVHGSEIKIVTENDRGLGATNMSTSIQGVDGLITRAKDVLCTAFFADCVPLYFFDPKSKYIGIAHAGWRGTVLGIGQRMVETFQSLGVLKENLLVSIGPCISGEKYEVDETVIKEIPKQFLKSVTKQKQNKKYLLDLKRLNSEILLHSGILRHNISITNYCTHQNDDLFFSYRRDRGKTGRMIGYIGYSINQ